MLTQISERIRGNEIGFIAVGREPVSVTSANFVSDYIVHALLTLSKIVVLSQTLDCAVTFEEAVFF